MPYLIRRQYCQRPLLAGNNTRTMRPLETKYMSCLPERLGIDLGISQGFHVVRCRKDTVPFVRRTRSIVLPGQYGVKSAIVGWEMLQMETSCHHLLESSGHQVMYQEYNLEMSYKGVYYVQD